MLFSVIFKKSENDGIRMSIHPALFGAKTERNELTKRIILSCHKLIRGNIPCENFLLEKEE